MSNYPRQTALERFLLLDQRVITRSASVEETAEFETYRRDHPGFEEQFPWTREGRRGAERRFFELSLKAQVSELQPPEQAELDALISAAPSRKSSFEHLPQTVRSSFAAAASIEPLPEEIPQHLLDRLKNEIRKGRSEPLGLPFVPGQAYTRQQIGKELGGSPQSYLPTVAGLVVCACLKREVNSRAPAAIFVGRGPEIERSAKMLSRQTPPIPVFIKDQAEGWTYQGLWRVKRMLESAEAIAKEAGSDVCGFLRAIILMEAAGSSAPLGSSRLP